MPSEAFDRIARVFLPYAAERTDKLVDDSGRFVYYTTSDTAMKLLRNREIWMRSATTMNDISEVDHGLSCLI